MTLGSLGVACHPVEVIWKSFTYRTIPTFNFEKSLNIS
jgi:hypothetical protein